MTTRGEAVPKAENAEKAENAQKTSNERKSAARPRVGRGARFAATLLTPLSVGCSEPTSGATREPARVEGPRAAVVTRLFPTDARPSVTFTGCVYASPLHDAGAKGDRIVVATGGGEVALLDPRTGAVDARLSLPAPDGEAPFVVGTPVAVGRRLVVGYHTIAAPTSARGPEVTDPRLRHRMAVIDLDTFVVDDAFPAFDLAARLPATSGGEVLFRPGNAIQRGALAHAGGSADAESAGVLGKVYVPFGNVRDIQPWHGFLFEVDLDAWRARGPSAAVASVFTTTPEADCGPEGASGSRERVCGGGLWSPAGPLVVTSDTGYDVFVASGNGQLDLARRDYANSILRLRAGLRFDPGCDATKCADFDRDEPQKACIETCKDLFIPRLAAGDPPMRPASGVCDGLPTYACWQKLDYLGGSTPVSVELAPSQRVLAYPAKDGHVYLVDEAHLGTMHDRTKLVEVCGTREDPCTMDWAGMIVTKPALSAQASPKRILVPTFMPDRTHPAGLVALDILRDGDGQDARPRFRRAWEWPPFTSGEAKGRFRRHPSRVTIGNHAALGGEVAWLVEAAAAGGRGTLHAIRVRDGERMVSIGLTGPGYRFYAPLVVGDAVYVASCDSERGPSAIEGYSVGLSAPSARTNEAPRSAR
jgi:hypothetical protein